MTFLKGVAIVTTSILLSVGVMELAKIISESRKSNRAEQEFRADMDSAGRAAKARNHHALNTVRAGLITIVRNGTWSAYKFPVHNAGTTPMQDVSVSLALKDNRGRFLESLHCQIHNIPAGKTVEWSTTDETPGVASAEFTCIHWASGTICNNEGQGIPRIE